MGVTCNTCIFSCSFFDTFDFLFHVLNHKKMAIVFFLHRTFYTKACRCLTRIARRLLLHMHPFLLRDRTNERATEQFIRFSFRFLLLILSFTFIFAIFFLYSWRARATEHFTSKDLNMLSMMRQSQVPFIGFHARYLSCALLHISL